jgi:hypothetical protein
MLIVLSLWFTACPVDPEDDTGGGLIELSLPIDGSGGRRYYDLSTGTELSPAGTNWDLALEAHDNTFFVLTNSGVTAAETSSGGLGGVWFTNETDFGAVTTASQRVIPDAGNEYAAYTEDVTRWVIVMAAAPVRQILNVITYLGYPSGDGLAVETYFNRKEPDQSGMASFVPYDFNKKQAYTMRGMPPSYTPTKQVYVVRHRDGEQYSKVQVSEVYLESGSPYLFVIQVRHEPVE